MQSILHPLFNGANSIPAEVRPHILEALQRNAAVLSWDRQDLEYLFTVYNRYVAPQREPEDIGCGGCRTKVIGKMKQYAQIWTQGE